MSAEEASAGLEQRRRRAIAEQELAADRSRVERAARIAVVAWLAFGACDYLQANYAGTGHLDELWTLRVAVTLAVVALGAWVHLAEDMRGRKLEAAFFGAIATINAGVSAMCIYSGGFESHYAAGMLVSTPAVVLLPRPWQRGLAYVGLVLLPYPLVLFGSTLVLPAMRAQLATPKAISLAVLFHLVGIGAWLFYAFVSHTLWSIRRELYESRSMGRYRLERRLGMGGMGEVWAAYHVGLKRHVAVKILKPRSDFDGQSARRFEREIHAMAGLSHPNTVRLYDFGVAEDGSLYYAMELLEGETMSSLVARSGPLPPARVIHLLVQAARALGEAHARWIVHRDVKSENLFVATIGNQGDVVKVLDFGIASVIDEPGLAVTRTGSILGTVSTISPEVVLGEPATTASDVYGLGVVAYQLVTGVLPFGEDKSGATLVRHVQEEPVPPSLRTGRPIPDDFERVVMRCLAKDPTQRYADASELADALEACTDAGRWRPTIEERTDATAEPDLTEETVRPSSTRRLVRPNRGT